MPFDGLMLAAVCAELNQTVLNSRIEKIYQPAKNDILLHISRPRERYRLFLSAHPREARIHLTYRPRENPMQPPAFCMLLRKHLEGGYIKKIVQPGLERVLKIHIDARDSLGQPVEKVLITEIMGKHSNILLVNPAENYIYDGIRRYSHQVSRHREVLPGRPYIAPPAQDKLNPLTLDEETFRSILLKAPLEKKVFKALQANFEGLSTVMTREIIYRALLPENLVLDHCGEHEFRVIWQALESIILPAAKNEYHATMITSNNQKPVDFAAFDLTFYNQHQKIHDQPSEIIDNFFAIFKLHNCLKKEKQSLTTKLNKEKKRLQKKMMLQQQSALQAENADQYKIFGELLTANIYRLEKGLCEAKVDNFYDPEYRTVNITLKPELTPAENAQAYFKKYVKAKKTRQAALKQARKTKKELDYVLGVLFAVGQTTDLANIGEIKLELLEQGYIKSREDRNKNKKGKRSGKKQGSLPYSFLSSDGYAILAGRNNKQNDRLAMKTAQDTDLWLHTKDIPGSHVIIRAEGSSVPERTIYEAAVIAAYFSQARDSENVPVDYTHRKNVKKPRGAKPGYVIYEQQRTAFVNPDQKLVASLAVREENQQTTIN